MNSHADLVLPNVTDMDVTPITHDVTHGMPSYVTNVRNANDDFDVQIWALPSVA